MEEDNRHDPNLQNPDTIGDRPRITLKPTTSKYSKGATVYIDDPEKRSYEGPFLIEKVVSVAKYTLCFENGDKAKNGEEFEEEMLVDG